MVTYKNEIYTKHFNYNRQREIENVQTGNFLLHVYAKGTSNEREQH